MYHGIKQYIYISYFTNFIHAPYQYQASQPYSEPIQAEQSEQRGDPDGEKIQHIHREFSRVSLIGSTTGHTEQKRFLFS